MKKYSLGEVKKFQPGQVIFIKYQDMIETGHWIFYTGIVKVITNSVEEISIKILETDKMCSEYFNGIGKHESEYSIKYQYNDIGSPFLYIEFFKAKRKTKYQIMNS